MCPAPRQITAILCVRRAATSQPGRIAANLLILSGARKNRWQSLCTLHYLSRECRRHSPEELRETMCLAGALNKILCRTHVDNTLK